MRHLKCVEKRVRTVEKRTGYAIGSLLVMTFFMVVLTEGGPQESIFWAFMAGETICCTLYCFQKTFRKATLLLLLDIDLAVVYLLKLPFILLFRGLEGAYFELRRQVWRGVQVYLYIWSDQLYELL